MLTRMRAALVAFTALVSFLAVAPAAKADPPVCTSWGPSGECLIWTGGGGSGGGGSGGGGGGSGGSGGGGVQFITINGLQCNPAGLASPQPSKIDPVWGGHTDGAIFDCVVPPTIGRGGLFLAGLTIPYWAASAPPPPPDPRQLAQQAVASMNLSAITMGLVPEPGAGSVGLVGMPNWMWVQKPTENTWGPTTRSASAGGWTVMATAKVSQVKWDMGDGQVVECAGPGTAYLDSYGKTSSPNCGHTYTRQGNYTVRATSLWVITWAGIGQTGTITMDLTQTAPVTIGEAQVLRQ